MTLSRLQNLDPRDISGKFVSKTKIVINILVATVIKPLNQLPIYPWHFVDNIKEKPRKSDITLWNVAGRDTLADKLARRTMCPWSQILPVGLGISFVLCISLKVPLVQL